MADNKNEDIQSSPAWGIISRYCEDEIKAKSKHIVSTLKSGEIVDINKTFAELRNKAGHIQALESILEIPKKLKAANKEPEE